MNKTLRRAAELRMAALSVSAQHGSEEARAEQSKIAAALHVAKDDSQLALALRNAGVTIKV